MIINFPITVSERGSLGSIVVMRLIEDPVTKVRFFSKANEYS
jgi:hypothetical protein